MVASWEVVFLPPTPRPAKELVGIASSSIDEAITSEEEDAFGWGLPYVSGLSGTTVTQHISLGHIGHLKDGGVPRVVDTALVSVRQRGLR